MTSPPKIRLHFTGDPREHVQSTKDKLIQRYGQVPLEEANLIVALGGDGFMLHTLHHALKKNIPVFGMNLGSVGFLMNAYEEEDLENRLQKAEKVQIHPLHVQATQANGTVTSLYALNEVSLLRQQHQASKIHITIEGQVRLDCLIGDGILVATPAGSTAYNLSASGPILPLTSNLIALTPLSPFRPRRWRGALLPDTVTIDFIILEGDKRPVSASADYQEVRDISSVSVCKAKDKSVTLLFDSHQTLSERLISEQFES